MPDAPANPFSELDPVQNVSTSLDFLVQRAINAKDPEQAYADDLIRAVAASPASDREKTKLRLSQAYGKDFSKRRFLAAVKEAMLELLDSTPRGGLIETANGGIKAHLENACIDLGTVLKLGYDTFSCRVTILNPTPWGTDGVWRDIDGVEAARWLQRRRIDVGEALANRAAYSLAHQNPFHPVRDYLTGLKHDGIARLEEWIIRAFGVEDTPLHRKITQAWTISMVKRIMEPGCKADYVIVIEGKQRRGKSTVLRALTNGHTAGQGGTQWFRDRLPKMGHKDFEMLLQGVWLYEVQELGAVRGAAWEDVKAVFSSQVDTFRSPYGYNIQDYPRQVIFAGTTNERQWGGDDTGLTRFWPFWATKCDPQWVIENRDQIFAEAMFRYSEGALSYLDKEAEAEVVELQDARMPDNPWIERVANYTLDMQETSCGEVLAHMADKFKGERVTKHDVGRALSHLSWTRFQKREFGERVWRYIRPKD